MNRKQAFEIVNKLQAVWDQREMSEETARAYIDAIEPLPFEAVGLAVMQLQKSETFRPSIALLYSTANELMPGHKLPDADAAWNEVCEQIHKIGSLRGMLDFSAQDEEGNTIERRHEPTWTHAVVGQVAESLGWDELCMSENVMADRAHFIKLYDTAKERNRRQQNMTPLEQQYADALGLIGKKPEEIDA